MNENKLKNFLIKGPQALMEGNEGEPDNGEEYVEEEIFESTEDAPEISEDVIEEDEVSIETTEPAPCAIQTDDIMDELRSIRAMLEEMMDREPSTEPVKAEMPDMSPYLTTREQLKTITAFIEKRDGDASNKNLVRTMEQIAVMREDFFRLCKGMKERIDDLSAADVLSSFEAYSVDMENILIDGGVYIGPFEYEKLNTLHQRIIGVVPTDDQEKNGMIAERLSDGYKMGNKVLLKEKVMTYKFTEASQASETDSKTVCDNEESGKDQEEEE